MQYRSGPSLKIWARRRSGKAGVSIAKVRGMSENVKRGQAGEVFGLEGEVVVLRLV